MKSRPEVLDGRVWKIETGCGNMYVTLTHDQDGLFEAFASLGKAGQCGSAQIESICRMISMTLRSGVDISQIVKQLRGIRCPNIKLNNGLTVLSCADAIAKIIEREIMQYWTKKE